MRDLEDLRPDARRAAVAGNPGTKRVPRVLAVSAAAVLALSACSGSGGSDGASSSTPPASSSNTASSGSMGSGESPSGSATGSMTGSATSSGQAGAGAGQPATSLQDAAETALKEVEGGTLVSIEIESDGDAWEVQVVTDDGTEHEMDIAMADGQLIGSPSVKKEDAQDRKKHQDRVAAAKLDYQEAAKKLEGAVSNAHVVELNLDSERGKTVWEGDLVDADGTKHAVAVDAATGEVVKNAVDSDD